MDGFQNLTMMTMNKYQNVLNKENREHWDSLTKIFDDSTDYIKANYGNLDIEKKIAAVYVVKNIYLQTNDFSMNQISTYIDKFFTYIENNYESYRSQYELISDEFHFNLSFYQSFIEKKEYLVDTL